VNRRLLLAKLYYTVVKYTTLFLWIIEGINFLSFYYIYYNILYIFKTLLFIIISLHYFLVEVEQYI
jgi:hypothetical protein